MNEPARPSFSMTEFMSDIKDMSRFRSPVVMAVIRIAADMDMAFVAIFMDGERIYEIDLPNYNLIERTRSLLEGLDIDYEVHDIDENWFFSLDIDWDDDDNIIGFPEHLSEVKWAA